MKNVCFRTFLLLCVLSCLYVPGTAARAEESVAVPWNAMDIGSPQPAGTAAENDAGAFALTAGGIEASTTRQGFQFVYQSVTGDFSLIARVTALAGTSPGAQAGLMVRDALADNVNFASVAAPGTLPTWLRLIKRGGTISAYAAPDANGVPGTWRRTGPVQAIPDEMLYAGLFVTSHAPGVSASATVDHVSLTVGLQPGLDPGTYILSPVSAPALNMAASAASGPALAGPTGAAGEQWTITSAGNGLYVLHWAVNPTLVLSVAGSGASDGAHMVLLPDQALPSQRWRIAAGPDGSVVLSPASSPTRALDDFGGVATPQAVLDIWGRSPDDPHTEWTATTTRNGGNAGN